MKKTFTINLGGKVLNIDDDALESLQQYINALKAHYSKGEDGEEIMYDIESRLAELFIENLKQENRESVSIPDVEQAISIMRRGSPGNCPTTRDSLGKDFTQKTVPGPARPHLGRRGLRARHVLGNSGHPHTCMFPVDDVRLWNLLPCLYLHVDAGPESRHATTKTTNERKGHQCFQHRRFRPGRFPKCQREIRTPT